MDTNTDRVLKIPQYSPLQLTGLVILRILIGWHFLYEGFAKVLNPNWTAAGFLLDSKWLFSNVFIAMAQNSHMLAFVDFTNKWGLVMVGLGLIAGALTRVATGAGILLLIMYYVATPPLIGLSYSIPFEGSYLIVNKNMVEAWALVVLLIFPTGRIIGLDRLLFPKK